MSLFDLSGKVAIVTGGSSGIGLGMARGLAGAGATVVIAARNVERCQSVVDALEAAGHKASALALDVADPASIEAMAPAVEEQHGRIDILVNNAGTAIRKMPEEYSAAEWHQVIDTNLTSAFLCAQAVYPAMKRAGGGKILNNGSMMSIFGAPWAVPYGASKGGIVQMTKGLAMAWAKDNIQVNAFLPGYIDTPLTVQAREQVPGLYEKVLARTAAGRWGEVDDFQGIAVFLAGPASDFITGVAIPVDGGYSTMA